MLPLLLSPDWPSSVPWPPASKPDGRLRIRIRIEEILDLSLTFVLTYEFVEMSGKSRLLENMSSLGAEDVGCENQAWIYRSEPTVKFPNWFYSRERRHTLS